MSNWILKAELKTRQAVENFVKGEEAPTAVEYGIMVALIAVAILTVVGTVGDNLNTIFTDVADALVEPTE